MFTGNVMLVPGQELRGFRVYRTPSSETATGRPVAGKKRKVGEIQAILAHTTPDDQLRWGQPQHPVTHKIVMQHTPPFKIRPGDIFVMGKRQFYLQANPRDPGDLGHWTVFYTEERTDVA